MMSRPSAENKEDIDLTTFAYQEINAFDKVESLETLRRIVDEHQLDPNFPQDILDRASCLLKETEHSEVSEADIRQVLSEIAKERDLQLNDSPYPEVRAVVSNTDDPSTPCNTFRVWFIGIVFSVLGCAINQLFYYRMPGISISHYVAQFAAYPCGKFLARWLPEKRYNIFGFKFSLNPGPFNQKEHTLISVMTAVSFGGAYVTDIFVVQRLKIFYDQNEVGSKAGYQILLALSTQLLGYGCAGITRRFLVYPAQMIWPSNLAVIALNRAMHSDDGKTPDAVRGPFRKLWTISRSRFLFITFGMMFLYFWFPSYLFQAMSTFNWISWISPSSVMLAVITGSFSGIGLNPFPTLDWNVVTSLVDPVVTPFFATANIAFGMFIVGLVFLPAIYFTNTWSTAYLPMNSNYAFDNTNHLYNVSRVLDARGELNVTAYNEYSPAYFSASNAVSYAAFFVAYTATISYVFLYHRKEIWNVAKGFRSWTSLRESRKDVHNRLMMVYKEVPEWWYVAIGVVAIIFGIMCVEGYDTGMPVWAIFSSVALCLILQIPIGIIMAVTNIEITNNVLAEFIGGYCLPGKPIPVMIFKSYGFIATSQSISFSSDMKLGFYMKVPPRVLFATQTIATVIGALTSVAVTDWVIVNVPELCTAGQKSRFSCPYTNTFFSSSVIWGVVGPKRIYGEGGIYHVLTWGFILGLLLPVPIYLYTLRYPRSWLRQVYVPVILAGALNWAPYNLTYIWPTLVVGFFFNYYLKRHYVLWWTKYAYVLTTSWNIAIACTGIVIFFCVGFNNRSLNWWGNSIPSAGCDGEGCPYLQLPESGSF